MSSSSNMRFEVFRSLFVDAYNAKFMALRGLGYFDTTHGLQSFVNNYSHIQYIFSGISHNKEQRGGFGIELWNKLSNSESVNESIDIINREICKEVLRKNELLVRIYEVLKDKVHQLH